MGLKRKWAHADPKTIAQVYTHKEIGGFLSPDLIIGPNEELLLIEDGRIRDSITQTKVKKITGGVFDKLKNLVGKGKNAEVMFVDTSDKEIVISFGEDYTIAPVTVENDTISGSMSMLFNIDRHNIANLYSRVKGKKGRILTTRDIKKEIRREIGRRVLVPRIGGMGSEEIGSLDAVKRIENECRRETGKRMELLALDPIQFTIGFDRTKVQRIEIEGRDRELAHQRQTEAFRAEKVGTDRLEEVQKWSDDRKAERTKHLHDRAADMGDHRRELEHKHRMGLERDRHEEEMLGYRDKAKYAKENISDRIAMDEERQGARIAMEKRDNEAKVERSEMLAESGRKIDADDFGQDMNEMRELMKIKAQKDEIKLKRKDGENKLEIERFREVELRDRELQAETAKAIARSEAEKARYNLETYERGLDRMEVKAEKDLGQIARILESSKPNVPHTLVQGAPPTRTIMDLTEMEIEEMECPDCGAAVSLNASFCPKCGEKLES